MERIDFWYSIGSTYSYLTVMRIRDVAWATGVDLRWRPFNVREIMVAQNNIPFKDKPVKTAYMWRDIERRAAMYGLPARLPAPYPLEGLELANRVALLGVEQGWAEAFTVESYRMWFQDGLPAGSEPNISEALRLADQDPDAVLEEARGHAAGADLAAQTEACKAMGVFGSPSFVVHGEVFWGDDRLDDALAWAVSGHL
ncbi:2-hydroxychromene-2-carboxylate isomerase [Psychromarinibacter sp. S121]|uniref:2-hydroxychromene-2-carboxylate isomerase n=1 Tax=Psychromarinibacter sp. S121 TaxID=3415127 RepID=UPI003C7CF90A